LVYVKPSPLENYLLNQVIAQMGSLRIGYKN